MLTAAIVLYHNDEDKLMQAVNSFLSTPLEKKLYLIDNSKTDSLKKLFISPEITYIHTGKNLGFGKGHNFIMGELKKISSYHLILNPDAYFGKDVIPLLIECLKKDAAVGLVAPKILYPNGEFQKSIRKFPKPQDFLIRRIPVLGTIFKNAFSKANYLDKPINDTMEVEAVSGCFQLFRTKVFLDIFGFDTRYFMYMEDIDICRKVHDSGHKVLYFPDAFVFHHSEYGSKKEVRLLWSHVKSIAKYFVKWNL